VIRLAGHPNTHAILLDCMADNLEAVCDGLRRDDRTGRIPIAALVGANCDRHIELIEAGIDESLVRPLAPARLLQFLKNGAAGGPRRDDLGQMGSGRTLRQLEIWRRSDSGCCSAFSSFPTRCTADHHSLLLHGAAGDRSIHVPSTCISGD
jgi:DNA-binding response OmpR family regulator